MSGRRHTHTVADESETDGVATPLVTAAQHGDRAAFAELYRRYSGMVRTIARRRLRPDEVSDAVQEAFFRAWRRLKTLRNTAAFGRWIATITRNVVCDAERERSSPAATPEQEPRKPDTQYDEMQARVVLSALRSLPKAYRTTLTLRLLQGMTAPEIADRTGLSPASVRVNLHRGMKLLRHQLERGTTRTRCA